MNLWRGLASPGAVRMGLKELPQTPPCPSQIECLVLSPIPQVGKQAGQAGKTRTVGGLRRLPSSGSGPSWEPAQASFGRARPTFKAGSGKKAGERPCYRGGLQG